MERTVEFLRDPPAEPFCYKRMLKAGYYLQKVYLGKMYPGEKPKNKRKAADAETKETPQGSKKNPIRLK